MLIPAEEVKIVDQNYEYMIVYLTPYGKRAGLYRGMNKEELDIILEKLKNDGCTIEKVEIVRRVSV